MPARLREAPVPMTKSLGSYSGYNSAPQWMKTLEERYQRLHMKIVYNTGTMGQKYNSTIGRQICDPKLVKAAINRARANSTKLASVKIAKRLTKSNFYGDGKTKIDIANLPASKSSPLLYVNDSKKDFDDDGQKRNTCVDEYLDSDEENRYESKLYEDNRVEDSKEDEDTVEDQIKNMGRAYERNADSEVEIEEVFGQDNGTGNDIEEIGTDKKTAGTRLKSFHRMAKTSVSRTSNNTSTSCPAAIESSNVSKYSLPDRMNLGKSTKRRSLTAGQFQPSLRHKRAFNNMSYEAQHAMTETIHESDSPRQRKSVSEETENGATEDRTNNPEPAFVLQKSVTTLEYVHRRKDWPGLGDEEEPNYAEFHSESDFSLCSKKRPKSSRSGRTRLPEIHPDLVDGKIVFGTTRNSSSHHRIPGIGMYNIPSTRENMFEITPLGYDIRYRDVIQVEERESETPPPDIKKKAFEKCSEWLNRYIQH